MHSLGMSTPRAELGPGWRVSGTETEFSLKGKVTWWTCPQMVNAGLQGFMQSQAS
jgi:aconitase A